MSGAGCRAPLRCPCGSSLLNRSGASMSTRTHAPTERAGADVDRHTDSQIVEAGSEFSIRKQGRAIAGAVIKSEKYRLYFGSSTWTT